MRNAARYAIALIACVLCGCLLLYLAGLAPQAAVDAHLAESAAQFRLEGLRPGVLYAGHPRSTLDNYSELQILLRSAAMDTRTAPASVLGNPGFSVDGSALSDAEEVEAYASALERGAAPNSNYVRYWMGFRAFVRPLLALVNYMDARQALLWGFCLMLGAVSLLLYRETRSLLLALSFVFVISQLNPTAITASFQFSTCFFLAFGAMLCVLLLPTPRAADPLLFFLFGAATQFFDFYTAPLLCFGLPLLALLCRMQAEPGGDFRLGRTLPLTLRCFAAWMAAYLLMWLAKLLLTSLFTPIDAFADAFGRVALWLTPAAASGAAAPSPVSALFACAINLTDVLPLAAELALFALWLAVMLRRRPPLRALCENLSYLAVGLIPMLWIAAAAKPSYLHAYFQYRSLGVSFFALCAFLLGTLPKRRAE